MYQNGKLIDVKYYTDTKPKAGNKIEVSFTAQLVSGTTSLRQMHLARGRLEGKSSPILVKFNAPKPASTLYILATGVDKYENSKYNLKYAKADAVSLSGEVAGLKNKIFKDVVVKTLFDADATIKM
ncbi:MAG: hypothetical protein IPN18_04865 [Ignavibacteriales bacterium]|nr:hypothetical protein [Ignavibacteriales bacterium]